MIGCGIRSRGRSTATRISGTTPSARIRPIHIVVDHGHVTLTGVVNNNVDRMLARSLVNQFGVMSVKNDLKTDAEMRDALEKS